MSVSRPSLFLLFFFGQVQVIGGSPQAQSEETASEAQQSFFGQLRSAVMAQNSSEALKLLQAEEVQSLSLEDRALAELARGKLLSKDKKWEEAQKALEQALEQGTGLKAYAHYHLALSHKHRQQYDQAANHYEQALLNEPNRQLRRTIRFSLGNMAMERNQWVTAARHFSYVEQRWRNNEMYPEVLWRLIRVELHRDRKWMACRWARRIYANHPTHPLVFDWGIDLQQARFDGEKLGCVATQNDQDRRIRRFQWSGESDRARREIETLQSRVTEGTKYDVDAMLAQFLVNEGFVDEALSILIRYYQEKQKNFDYLMLLARAASRAGEYQTAVGAYHSAHLINPRSRQGRQALFHSGFLSYQFQDYDGASRKFHDFVQTYPSSGLARDSLWHLAWIRYLKGDYTGAIEGFEDILARRQKARRAWARHPADKILYWKGMSYFRMEMYPEAYDLFTQLIDEDPRSFYSLAARERLMSLPDEELTVPLMARSLASEEELSLAQGASGDVQNPEPQVVTEELESEDDLASEVEPEEDYELEVAGADEEFKEEDEQTVVTGFESVALQARFDRASDLAKIGEVDWARWELFEIERRTRNKNYLKMLMSSYEGIGAYNRSVSISELRFRTARESQGYEGERQLWEWAYPKAFSQSMESYARQFGVNAYFAWSIMKAESRFQPGVVSPVGARGLMQIMPNTGRQISRLMGEEGFADDELFQPDVNIRLGTRYLSRLGRMFRGALPLMAAGYNAGPHRVETWLHSFGTLDMDEFIEHIPFLETRNYVKRVLGYYGAYTGLYANDEGAPSSLDWLARPIGVPIPTRAPARENWEPLSPE